MRTEPRKDGIEERATAQAAEGYALWRRAVAANRLAKACHVFLAGSIAAPMAMAAGIVDGPILGRIPAIVGISTVVAGLCLRRAAMTLVRFADVPPRLSAEHGRVTALTSGIASYAMIVTVAGAVCAVIGLSD